MSEQKQITSINPSNGEVIARYDPFDLKELDAVMDTVAKTQSAWGGLPPAKRAEHLANLAHQLLEDQEELARLASLEMGKPIKSSRAEVEKCAWVCEYYAEQGEQHLRDRPIETEYAKSYIAFRPLGVLLAIMPWNFPYWQVFRFLAPALMAGNAVVLKHASNVAGCSLAIENTLTRAGLPENLLRSLLVGSREAGALIQHPLIRGVTFTGSTGAGKKIAALAGESVRKTVLELGGSDPYLVLADADLETAVQTCAASRLINNGQSCIAAKRFIVHESRYDDFVAGMEQAMSAARMGDPLDENTELGPMAREDLCKDLADQVQRSLSAGAQAVTGGKPEGNFYPPTVLAEVTPGMPAFDEELFGPVAAVVKAGSDEEAVALANRSEFGLGAAVFTGDVEKGEAIARNRLDAGSCFVNAKVASDPRLPFGGIKASGYGRELGPIGITEFTNIKTVVIG